MRDNRTNALPFPPLFHPLSGGFGGVAFLCLRLLYYLPVPVYAAAAGISGYRLLRGQREAKVLLLFALFGFLAFNQTLWRSDLAHLLQSLPPYYFLSLWLIDRSSERKPGLKWALAGGAPLVLLALLFHYCTAYRSPMGPAKVAAEGFQPIPPYYTGSVAQIGGEAIRLSFPKARVRVPLAQASFFYAVQEELDKYSSPGDFILTVPGLQLVYFLFDRKNPTRYIHLRRALDSLEEEDRYIRDIVERPTCMVLLRDVAIDGRDERRFSRYAARVVAAIEKEFEVVSKLGDLTFYVRRESGS